MYNVYLSFIPDTWSETVDLVSGRTFNLWKLELCQVLNYLLAENMHVELKYNVIQPSSSVLIF